MKRRANTSAARFTRAYALLLIGIMVVISLAILVVVGSSLISNKRDQARELISTVQSDFHGGAPNWRTIMHDAPINPRTSYVRVIVRPNDAGPKVYDSKGTERFLTRSLRTRPLLKHVQYQEAQGVYYHTTKTAQRGNATVTYAVWLSLNNMINLFKTLLTVITCLTLIGLFIGVWLISWLARRLNRPLVQLTDAAENIADAETITYHETLPEAGGPREVQALSVAFNRLLKSLNEQVIRDHEFVSNASHELRTPISAVRGHVALIRRHGDEHPEIIPTSLATIDEESQKMQRLIESLLRLSRMDHLQLDKDWFDLSVLVEHVAAKQQDVSRHQLMVNVAPHVIVYANSDSIEQILVSLLSNASKYSPVAEPIEVTVQQQGGHAYLTVADLGTGVADSDKEKIFDRFYRADSARSAGVAGTGLGLAIAARLATLNNAKIAVSDNVPHGARFTLTLVSMEPNS